MCNVYNKFMNSKGTKQYLATKKAEAFLVKLVQHSFIYPISFKCKKIHYWQHAQSHSQFNKRCAAIVS